MSMTFDDVLAIERAALLGTRRRPLPVPASLAPMLDGVPPERRTLALLALAAQRRRLGAHPALAAPATVANPPEDSRPILPEPPRRSLRRFIDLTAPSPDLHFSDALAAILRLSGIRLHPHDLHRARRLKALNANYGPFEAWWRGHNGERANGAVALGEKTWSALTPANLRDAMRAWRAQAPAVARQFVQEIFTDASAEQRTALVEGLDVGVCADDAAFLEQAASDRSAKVREAVEQVAAGIPGLPAYRNAVAKVAAGLVVEKKFPMLRRMKISIDDRVFGPLGPGSTIPRVYLTDVATTLDIAVEDIVRADLHPRAAAVLLGFAAFEGRTDFCESLLTQAGPRARACLAASPPLPATVPLGIRRRLIAPLLDPSVYREPPENGSETALVLLHALGGPLDGDTIRRATAAQGFSRSCDLLRERADSADTWAPRGEIVGIAALTPPEAADEVLEAVRPLEPLSLQKDLRPMFAYLHFLADLAKAGIRVSDDPEA